MNRLKSRVNPFWLRLLPGRHTLAAFKKASQADLRNLKSRIEAELQATSPRD
jgi:hypothetical protein